MTATKIALVTGANTGLGLEIARQLAQAGVTVLIGARDPDKGRKAAQELTAQSLDARALVIDVTDPASISAAAAQIDTEFGRLDTLVNNAGIAPEQSPAAQADADILRRTFDTNFFGAFAVTQAMLPLLRRSDAGRIVNMSSELGSLTLCSDPKDEFYAVNPFAYGASKAALNALTVSLAKELSDTPLKVNSVTPGYTATALNNFSGPRTVEQGAREPVRLALLPNDGPTDGFFRDDGLCPGDDGTCAPCSFVGTGG